LKTLPQSSGFLDGGEWRSRSRTVVEAKLRFEQIQHLPGEDAEGALRALLDTIDAMAMTHADESIHQKRLIAVMVARTGTEPLAAGTDPVSDYQGLIKRLDDSLHGAVSLDMVTALWDKVTAVLRRLFLPPDARHEALTRLAAIGEPTQIHVGELMPLLASTNHLNFFLARISGPEWLELLEPSGLLDPLPRAPWPVIAAVERLAGEHAVPLLDFLTRIFEKYRADRDRTRSVAIAARHMGSAGHGLLLRAAQKHPAVEPLAWLVMEAAMSAEPADPFVQQAVDQVMNSAMQSGVRLYLSSLFDHYAKGVTADTYGERIRLLCFKLQRIPDRDAQLPRRGSITDPPEYDTEDPFPSLLRCLVQALSVAGEFAGMHNLLEAVSMLPTAMRDRFRSWILATIGIGDAHLLADEVFQAIRSRLPTGDDGRGGLYRVRPEDAVGVAVPDDLQVEVVRDLAAGQHGVELLPGLFAVGQAVHGVDGESLCGVHGGCVAELGGGLYVSGGESDAVPVAQVLDVKIAAACDGEDGPPVTVFDPVG
jgi:hypothetical protein